MFCFPELVFFSQTKQRNRKNSILFHIYTHKYMSQRERERSGPGTHGRWGGGAVVAAIYRRRRENERRACSPILSPFFQRFLKIQEREREREREAEEIGSRINYSNMGEKRTLACLGIILLFCLLFPFWVNFHFKFHLIHYFEFEFIFILVIYASKFFISKNKNKSSEFFILSFMFLEVYHEW